MRMSLPIPPPGTGCADTFTFSTWFRPSARAAPGRKTAIEHARAPENQVFLPDVIAPYPSFGERNVLLALRTNSWRRKASGDGWFEHVHEYVTRTSTSTSTCEGYGCCSFGD